MRLTGRHLNQIKTALAHRTVILKQNLRDDQESVKSETDEHPYGEDVKMVREHKLNLKLLTPAEQNEVITQYQRGMTMTAVADLFGCHYTTIGRLLRTRGVSVRK